MTSHDVVGRCRRIFSTRRVGHAGTLDPMATGVLVIGVERATKILGLLTETPSRTPPPSGWAEHVHRRCRRRIGAQRLGAAPDRRGDRSRRGRLRGDIEQVPSAVSAIKVDGQRAYRLAREGRAVELKARPVRIDRFEVLAGGAGGDSSISTSRSTARRVPTSVPWPATSGPRWGRVAT